MWDYIKNSNKKIVLYGTGNACERIMKILDSKGISISGIFASDDFVRNKVFHGYPVESYSALKERFGELLVLLCFGTHREEVIANIKRICADSELLAPDIPVIPEATSEEKTEPVFDKAYYFSHKDRIASARALLEDDQSCKVFDNVIKYRLTGRLDYLFDCESSDEELWNMLVDSDSEIYLDLGAYTGDTVAEFVKTADGRYGKIIAAEPDDRNFRKMTENTAHLDNVVLYHCGVGNAKEVRMFSQGTGRGSLSKKTKPVDFTTIDEIVKEQGAPTIIKMDVEGEEENCLTGGQKTISTIHPKMLVAAYHRMDDLWEVPLQVKALYPDYKMILRHSPCIPAWELNYIFIPKD